MQDKHSTYSTVSGQIQSLDAYLPARDVRPAREQGEGRRIAQNHFWRNRAVFDWIYAALLVAGAVYALTATQLHMTGYERAILCAATPALIVLGWNWRPLQRLTLLSGALALTAIWLYLRTSGPNGADLTQADHVFALRYFLASQSAILWMGVLFLMSTLFYVLGLFFRQADNLAQDIGGKLAWAGVLCALVGTMVRWFESHQMGAGLGHIPVSNLYEVLVLFCWMTTIFYLYYESRYRTRVLGAFVMMVVSAAVGFLWWYCAARGAQQIQPLIPALQSWWMKLHVPANFVGYGTFALAAMVSLAILLKIAPPQHLWIGLVGVPLVLIALPVMGFAIGASVEASTQASLVRVTVMALVLAALMALLVAWRVPLSRRLPPVELMEDLCYKAIAIGFVFFTIATVLGALWAADAWGGYWSWDPKETWALIVWLNYAAWLHMRIVKGFKGEFAAWWSLLGLVVTTFAFLGVNMFLSGLHSYGAL